MIHWLTPGALRGLIAIAVPIAIHLLRRERAPRLPFPSLRFVSSVALAPSRPRVLSDLVLLTVRVAIVAASAVAAAQPVFVTASRVAAWNSRIARAIVVDTSESMRSLSVESTGTTEHGAAFTRRFETSDLASGIDDATAWLASAPPARRELVVVSDFQQGSLLAKDLVRVPRSVGVRLAAVRPAMPTREVAFSMYGGERSYRVRARLEGAATLMAGDAPLDPRGGLRLIASPAQQASLGRLQRVVASAGAAAPSPDQPMAIVFGDAGHLAADTAHQPWMIATLLRMRRDPELRALRARPGPGVVKERWVDVWNDESGRPLVRAASSGKELILALHKAPDDLFSAVAVRAVLNARATLPREQEVLAIPPTQLAAWSRQPGDASVDGWKSVERSDARWFWALAASLLVAEHLVRQRTRRAGQVEEAHAA